MVVCNLPTSCISTATKSAYVQMCSWRALVSGSALRGSTSGLRKRSAISSDSNVCAARPPGPAWWCAMEAGASWQASRNRSRAGWYSEDQCLESTATRRRTLRSRFSASRICTKVLADSNGSCCRFSDARRGAGSARDSVEEEDWRSFSRRVLSIGQAGFHALAVVDDDVRGRIFMLRLHDYLAVGRKKLRS